MTKLKIFSVNENVEIANIFHNSSNCELGKFENVKTDNTFYILSVKTENISHS